MSSDEKKKLPSWMEEVGNAPLRHQTLYMNQADYDDIAAWCNEERAEELEEECGT